MFPLNALNFVSLLSHIDTSKGYSHLINKYVLDPTKWLMSTSLHLAANITLSAVEITTNSFDASFKAISNIQLIFNRIIYTPLIDPQSSKFGKKLDQFFAESIDDRKKVEIIDSYFKQKFLLSKDVVKLKNTIQLINQKLLILQFYSSLVDCSKTDVENIKKLIEIKNEYDLLDKKIKIFYSNKIDDILSSFDSIINYFKRGRLVVPNEVKQQLLTTWNEIKIIKEALSPSLSPPSAWERYYSSGKSSFSKHYDSKHYAFQDIEKKLYLLDDSVPLEIEEIPSHLKPLKLSWDSNSCYLDSALQATLCIKQNREKLKEPVLKGEKTSKEFEGALKIKKELLQFFEEKKLSLNRELTLMEFILCLQEQEEGASNTRLRKAIFESELHSEFRDSSEIECMHDAAPVVELLIDTFLPNLKFKWTNYTSTKAFPGLEFASLSKNESVSMLSLPLRHRSDLQTLNKLVATFLGKRIERDSSIEDQRKFDPKDGTIIEGEEDLAKTSMELPATKVPEYHEWYRINELPEVLTIHFKRFLVEKAWDDKLNCSFPKMKKDQRPVFLPKDGILNLTPYYDAPEGESPKALYRIKSMVRHIGRSLHGGHFVSEVEVGGRYYHCDDMDPKCYAERSREQFYHLDDPYILFLERIHEE